MTCMNTNYGIQFRKVKAALKTVTLSTVIFNQTDLKWACCKALQRKMSMLFKIYFVLYKIILKVDT